MFFIRNFRLKIFKLGFYFILIFSCSQPAESRDVVFARTQLLMGHVPLSIYLKIAKEDQKLAWTVTEKAFQKAREWELKLSEFQDQSEISCLIRNAGKNSCRLSPETLEILIFAEELHQKTQGAFNIRFASPTAESRQGRILLDLKNHRAKLENPQTKIGISALAKGWIIDHMVELLKEEGFSKTLINGAGDLRASGSKWKAAIQIPGSELGRSTHRRKIQDQAWASSGNYENKGNIRDPRNGKTIIRDESVTVKSTSLMLANALSTSLYVLGPEWSDEILNRFPEIHEIVWVDTKGKTKIFKK